MAAEDENDGEIASDAVIEDKFVADNGYRLEDSEQGGRENGE